MTPIGLAPPPQDTELPEPAVEETAVAARPVISSRRAVPQPFLGPPLWLSLGVHLAILLGLILYGRIGPETIPYGPPGEGGVQYIDLAFPSGGEAGGGPAAEAPAQPSTAGEAGPSITAPESVPSGVAPAREGEGAGVSGDAPAPGGGGAAAPGERTGEGGAGGGGGVADRLRPGFSDARLYGNPEITRMRQPAPSDIQRYREHFQARVDALNDSLYGRTGPDTDWTVKDGSGKRWGVSEDGVHLGPITIPRALVPFPAASGTNKDLEEAREERRQREEIDRQEADRERRRALEESRAAAQERREQERQEGADPDG